MTSKLLAGLILFFRIFMLLLCAVFRLASLWYYPLSLTLLGAMATLFFGLVNNILLPLCAFPGFVNTDICSDLHTSFHKACPSSPLSADFPQLMNIQMTMLEELLNNFVGSSGLSLEIKKAEVSISDLIVLVKYSDLTNKDVLRDALATFACNTRRTGRSLQTLGSKIGGALDLILMANNHALAMIHSETLSIIIHHLILLAEVSLLELEKLEEHLSLIYEMVYREDSLITSAKIELLGRIWTWLGGNRLKLRGPDNCLKLLQGIGRHHNLALAHVVSSLQILRALSNDMEDMRARMIMPEHLRLQIPLEVQVSSIQHSLEWLRESKALAKKEVSIRKMSLGDK
ncbi:hypothetical protein F5876DRAFT_69769 [Lentinula aff. lateritia]|uniref:Uncharacterized protein n=1 Tax=Lentinula aff. lateritia TaxID=2804960 RepID=A0ACC1TLV1_9AGAR|nr:hypothetical protein F5876DRAFT_69769 [Lentinula aff. lateritia]